MLNQLKSFYELVQLWDLEQEEKDQKIEIFQMWEKILKEDEFETILKICNNFSYYSYKLTAEAYKTIFDKNTCNIDKVEKFIESSLFFPLRKKERVESAVDMFSSFRLVNNIDANRTKMVCPTEYLNQYKKSIVDLKQFVNENDEKNIEDKETIQNLNNQLILNKKNKIISKKLKKRINFLQNNLAKRENSLNKNIENFSENYLTVKNMIIIDDFIGTGNSVISFLEKIGNIIMGSDIEIKIYLWVIEASESGIKAIEKIVEELGIDFNISFYKESIDVLEEDKVFSTENISGVREIIKNINKQNKLRPSKYCKNHAIASFVNAPNNNLTLLSEESSTWTALFLRTKRNKVERKISSTALKEAYEFLRQ
ncbi:phosphoribosyltransferase-like protein [Bacillus altitudinis]|uniref:phosphoribosyltransferase-like protein n=1 Tax=Bacillus altitudinis TaxID=293387 RepID=UPI002E20B15E|nr:hypothetical protein [Bacillus altitudinis]